MGSWLERILATKCPDGHDSATPGHWCVTGHKQEGYICASRIQAAEETEANRKALPRDRRLGEHWSVCPAEDPKNCNCHAESTGLPSGTEQGER